MLGSQKASPKASSEPEVPQMPTKTMKAVMMGAPMSWPFTWAPLSLGVAGVVGEIQGDGGVKGDHGSQGGEELRPEALAVAACHLSGEQCGKSSLLTGQPEGPDNDYAAENDQDGGGEILQEADGPAAVVADVEIDEYKQAEAEEAVERQTGVGREDDGDDGVQSCAADPVLNPEPQAAHEGTDDGGNTPAHKYATMP